MINMLIQNKMWGDKIPIPGVSQRFLVNCFPQEDPHPIAHIWDWTVACSNSGGGIKNLLIACHAGYVGPEEYSHGGWGILLGSGMDMSNILLTKVLRDKVENIYFYCCGGAKASQPELKEAEGMNPALNNRLMITKMAEHTRCNIYASPGIQDLKFYSMDGKVIKAEDIDNGTPAGGFDFGLWEGRVELFKYIAGAGVVVKNVTSEVHRFGFEDGGEPVEPKSPDQSWRYPKL